MTDYPEPEEYVSLACRTDLHDDCPAITIRCVCPCHREAEVDEG